MTATLDLQLAYKTSSVPNEVKIQKWLDTALEFIGSEPAEITVRVVSEQESQQLNLAYRGKDKPTNVLSFPFEAPVELDIALLGDLVICADIVESEASSQFKKIEHHWAHMIVHGTLHLLGFDHITDAEAAVMEGHEKAILSKLGIDDPYQDH